MPHISHINLIPKVIPPIPSYFQITWFWKSQDSVETANPVTRILLKCTAQAAFRAYLYYKGPTTLMRLKSIRFRLNEDEAKYYRRH